MSESDIRPFPVAYGDKHPRWKGPSTLAFHWERKMHEIQTYMQRWRHVIGYWWAYVT